MARCQNGEGDSDFEQCVEDSDDEVDDCSFDLLVASPHLGLACSLPRRWSQERGQILQTPL